MYFSKSKLCLILVALILLLNGVVVFAQQIPTDFDLVAANECLELYARKVDGQLIVHDPKGCLLWYSNPDVKNISGFGMLSDVWQGNLKSPIYLDYFDKRRNVRGANAYFGKPEIEFSYLNSGFKIRYSFPNTGIGFSVEYTLDGDSLLAVIPWDEVFIGDGEMQLLSIRILPFFGAQPTRTDMSGFMLVPDGCGGLMRFKELVSLSQTGFNQWIYGLDPASAEPSYDPYREPVIMPIFGLKAGEQGFLGIVEQGQESAKVIATPAGVITDYNWISSEFWYSQSIIMRTARQGSGIRIFDANPIPGDRSVRYYFLTHDQANYVDMAQVYRQYLISKQGASRLDKSKWDAPLMVEILGADYETNVFGPVMQAMTTFEQAKTITDAILSKGVERFIINYHGWNRMGVNGNLPRRLPPEKSLGGADGLRDLANYLRDLGIPLLLQDDYTLARGSNNGFQPSTQASRTTFNDLIKRQSLGFAFGGPDVTTYLISPRISLDFAARDIPQIVDFGIDGITHLSLGAALNSDHNPHADKKTYRSDCKLIYQELIEFTKKHVNTAGITNGNAYMLGLADFIIGVPMEATRDSYIDQSIPFYQIATHGLITYYAKPVNLSMNPDRDLLRAVEYGALPTFLLSAEPSWKLRYTSSSSMYSTFYPEWLGEVVRHYHVVNENMQSVHDQFIIDHQQLDDNVYLTKYENGTVFVVNYGNESYNYFGTEVTENSFVVFNKEGNERQ